MAVPTPPTRGSARVGGRVGMLLAVGTGFHADLSGRENVFMNGAILGMTQSEIRRKYDDIVAFAELEDFMDLAIRHYSSGMCLRLALSVAVHLDAEVVFLDEIWAVGDLAFQTKSWRRIEELTGSDRTFVIVAHNLDTIGRLCGRCLLMDHGRLTMDGKPADVIARYREELRSRTSRLSVAGQALRLELVEARLMTEEVHGGDVLDCRLSLKADAAGEVAAALSIRDDQGRLVAAGAAAGEHQRWTGLSVEPGRNHFRCTLPASLAPDHNYQLTVELRTDQGLAAVSDLPFAVIGRDVVMVDEAGNELPVPAISVNWQRETDEEK